MKPLPPYLATTRRADHNPGDPRIFVFGSNLQSIHGAGAALYAAQKLDAHKWISNGFGTFGRTYAIPTCASPGVPLPLDEIKEWVNIFLAAVKYYPEKRFYVSAIGCGYAGYTEAEIAPLFRDAPENCDLPEGWRD